MMVPLVFALATIRFNELDTVVFYPINCADVCAVSTDDFHMFSLDSLRLWSQSTCQEPIKFTHPEPALLASRVRFGSKADMCGAKRYVRFAPESDRESRHPQRVMSALPLKADMCGANSNVS